MFKKEVKGRALVRGGAMWETILAGGERATPQAQGVPEASLTSNHPRAPQFVITYFSYATSEN